MLEDKDDILVFADDTDAEQLKEYKEPWKIIIADDDDEVHDVTRMVLEDTVFEERKIHFISAFSGEETINIIKSNPDTAVILLDVVMERDDSGLMVAKFIRDELKNTLVRIILRTGQPGQAPEREVITDYDINDYKEKTELTAQKLYTAVLASLRSYRDLKIINRNEINLEKIINNSSELFDMRTIEKFATNLLKQLDYFLKYDDFEYNDGSFSGLAISYQNGRMSIISSSGDFLKIKDKSYTAVDLIVKERISEAIKNEQNIYGIDYFVGYFESDLNTVLIIYFSTTTNFLDIDINFLKIFSTNISAVYDTIVLNKEIIDTQKEVVLTLGEVVETRSKETAYHVKRVAEISRLMAAKIGLNEDDCELIRMASPMHDVGKIGIPDAILNKPAKLTSEEYEIIKNHTIIGHDILKSSGRKILQAAAVIALQHHEWWNGEGYPHKIKGDEIHIFSRITSIVDVFDALSHKRVYKDAWSGDTVLDFIKKGSGTQFDPELVKVFFDSIADIMKIVDEYKD